MSINLLSDLKKKNLINPPAFVKDCLQYLTLMGSQAYGVANTNDKEELSDWDVYGFCIPYKDIVFPHLRGEIVGFGKQIKRFDQYQQHGVKDISTKKEYDFSIYNIVKYFQLCMENNPNMIDSLFTPQRCVLYCTPVANHVRENRKLFLHKGSWFKFKGYAFSQIHKMKDKALKQYIEECKRLNIPFEITPQDIEFEIKCRTSIQPSSEERPLAHLLYEELSTFQALTKRVYQSGHISKRLKSVQKYGYDCYSEDTEFLTISGWKKFDEISDQDLIGSVDFEGNLKFDKPITRIDKKYTGSLYTIEPYMTRCVITKNHNMLVSPAHRNVKAGSYEYLPKKGDWKLVPFKKLTEDTFRAWFHIRNCVNSRIEEYNIEDDYLRLAGLYISEGTINFRQRVKTGKIVNCVRITQVKQSTDFYSILEQIKNSFKLNEYGYDKKRTLGNNTKTLFEHIWITDRETGERLYKDFGHYSLCKALPIWCFQLSARQAKLFWDCLCAGNGTSTKNDQVYYTSNEQLAGDIQAMIICAGYSCSVRGPYVGKTDLRSEVVSYQVYLSNGQKRYSCVNFRRILKQGQVKDKKQRGFPIKETRVENARVVCFEMPKGTLITRNNGKIAIQGNCKFGYHVVRLLNEVEQILTEHNLSLDRNREQLKAIRRGEWKREQIEEYFDRKERELESVYSSSTLRHSPDESKIKQLLLNCLEMHFGSLDKCIVKQGQVEELVSEMQAAIDRYRVIR